MKLAINLAALAVLGLVTFTTAAHAQTTISSGTYTGNPGANGADGTPDSTNGESGSIGGSGYTASSGTTLIKGGVFTGGKGGDGGAGANAADEGNFDGGNGGSGGYALFVTGTAIVTLDGGFFTGGAGGAGGKGGRGFTIGSPGSAGSAGLPLFVGNGGTLYFGGTGFTNDGTTVSGAFSNGTTYSFSYATSGAFTIAAAPAAATPEPGSVALLVGMGVSGIAVLRRRRK